MSIILIFIKPTELVNPETTDVKPANPVPIPATVIPNAATPTAAPSPAAFASLIL